MTRRCQAAEVHGRAPEWGARPAFTEQIQDLCFLTISQGKLIHDRKYIWIGTGLKINTQIKYFNCFCLFLCLNFDGVQRNHSLAECRRVMSARAARWRCAPAPQSARRCPGPDAASSKSWQGKVFTLQSRRIPGSRAQI